MPDDTRIEDLRRRIRKDPASLAFAQLAEELRRARRLPEAVAVCRAGLALYPDYLSARVTLGRSFLDLNRLDEAERELEKVRAVAPENLVATRALAEIQERRATPGFRPQPDAAAQKTPGAWVAADAAYSNHSIRTIAALHSLLDAIHVVRARRRA